MMVRMAMPLGPLDCQGLASSSQVVAAMSRCTQAFLGDFTSVELLDGGTEPPDSTPYRPSVLSS